MAILVTIDHNEEVDFLSGQVIHILDEKSPCGEFTICGIAAFDTDFNSDGFVTIESHKGPISECTCKRCKEVLNYYKDLK